MEEKNGNADQREKLHASLNYLFLMRKTRTGDGERWDTEWMNAAISVQWNEKIGNRDGDKHAIP